MPLASDPTDEATILRVRGAVECRNEAKEEIPLRLGLRLIPGDTLRCKTKGGVIEANIYGTRLTLTELGDARMVILPNSPAGSGLLTAGRPILKEWFSKLKQERMVYSPCANGGAVWPERFVIRWTPPEKSGKAQVRIDAPSLPASEQNTYEIQDIRRGSFSSRRLHDMLVELSKRGTLTAKFSFWSETAGIREEFSFNILKEKDRDEIGRAEYELGSIRDEFYRHICHADLYNKYKLWDMAGQRLSDALKIAFRPDIRDMGATAYSNAGNGAEGRRIARQR